MLCADKNFCAESTSEKTRGIYWVHIENGYIILNTRERVLEKAPPPQQVER